MTALERLSLNAKTIDQWSLPELVEGCARAGLGWIAPWREQVAETGLERSARLISDAGLRVSSLCRGGFFTNGSGDNRRAVDEAAALGTDLLVLVCGTGRDLPAAREAIAEGIERLAPYAASCGVRLGIEPLHPMMIGERSAIVTLAQATDLALRFDDGVGVVVDAYHVFWDPGVEAELLRAGPRILGFHVSDWLVPTLDVLQGRGLMGDGIIDLPWLRGVVERAGYAGPIEVEVINRELWTLPGAELLERVVERFSSAV
jgi:sugar phosphate isomerase/epimerase